jgi:hypothetical protein
MPCAVAHLGTSRRTAFVIPFRSIIFHLKKALYRAEDKESPGVFLLLLRDIKVAKNLIETVSMFM